MIWETISDAMKQWLRRDHDDASDNRRTSSTAVLWGAIQQIMLDDAPARRINWLPWVSKLVLLGSLAIAPPVKATLPVSSLFWSMCVSAYDVEDNFASKERNDLAEQVAKAVQARMESVEPARKVLSEPNCIKSNQPGFDRQLFIDLSIKREKIKLDNNDWNLVIAGGVARNGLFQDRDLEPVVIVKREQITDEEIAKALEDFLDRSVVELIRQQRRKQ